MNIERSTAERVLKDWLPGAARLLYYPNPGNAGDALIAAATWQVFDRIGLRPKVARPRDFRRGASVILGGGGNLVPPYRNIALVLQACLDIGVARCLLLPHTVRGHEELLQRLDERYTLCCRDRVSLEHVRRHAPRATALLADDMVVGLDFAVLEARVASLRHKLALLWDRDWRRHRRAWRAALARQHPDAAGRLTLWRSDLEAATEERRDADLDLMRHYTTSCRHRAGCDQVAQDLVSLLRQATAVTTDRLHVALPAWRLGLQVALHDNNYGKLSAVWETSVVGSRRVSY